jgi:hypothetical protein
MHFDVEGAKREIGLELPCCRHCVELDADLSLSGFGMELICLKGHKRTDPNCPDQRLSNKCTPLQAGMRKPR